MKIIAILFNELKFRVAFREGSRIRCPFPWLFLILSCVLALKLNNNSFFIVSIAGKRS